MNDALSQAIGIQKTAADATQTAMANNPVVSQYDTALQASHDANVQASQRVADNITRRQAIDAEPLPAAVAPPTITLPERPKDVTSDPLRVFGQMAPVLAALSGLATRNPMVNSLNAATAAIEAAKSNDQVALKKAHEDWADNLKLAIDKQTQLNTQYTAALANRKMAMDERLAKINAIAAENGDEITRATLASGDLNGLSKRVELLQSATDKLTGVYDHVMERNQTAARDAESARSHRANEGIAATNAGKMNMAEVIAPLLQKVAGGGKLTAGEESAIAQYQALSASGSGNSSVFDQAMKAAQAAKGGAPPPVTGSLGAGAVATGAGTQAAPFKPTSKAAAAALPQGSWFTDPSGNLIQKK